ncbi:MAG: DUF6538 domain-containing protein [Alphaproteobacteria bacterium]
MVWVRSPVYVYKRGEMFYFSRAVPSDLQHRFDKRKVEQGRHCFDRLWRMRPAG